MAVSIDVFYRGELRCEAVHGPSGTRIVTDAPLDNRGKGASFSPSDLLATSIGTCMLTIMGMRAAERGWDLSGARARLSKEMVAAPRRRIGRVVVEIDVPAELDAEARDVLVRAALGCPVHASLEGAFDVPVRFRFGSIDQPLPDGAASGARIST